MATKNDLKIQSVTCGAIQWAHVLSNQKREIDALRRKYKFHPIDIRETLPPLQRPKIVIRDEYLFMILLYPVFDRHTRTIHSSEVDFFISTGSLVTVNNDGLPALDSVFRVCTEPDWAKPKHKKFAADDISRLVYAILNELLEGVFPMLLHLSADIDSIEAEMFKDSEEELIQELLRVKTNIVNVRKTLQGHKQVITQLTSLMGERYKLGELAEYFERLIEQTKEVWVMLELQRDTINALHEANASLIETRMNKIMRTLTLISVIVFPLTLFASIFSMRFANMPLLDNINGFWIILGAMTLSVLTMLAVFKRMKWI